MQNLIYAALFLGGLILLGGGGESLVRGASRLARRLGISPLVIGLTIVAFGTSAPEVAVSVLAAFRGENDIAVGNIVGSNIANTLLILGSAAALQPLRVNLNLVRFDLPVMLLVFALFMLLAIDNEQIDRWEGGLFLAGLVGYTVLTYMLARREPAKIAQEYEQAVQPSGHMGLSIVLIVVGVAGLVGGAELIVRGAVGFAEMFGVSRRVIGLTIVAIGTSLPELATTLIAARRNQPDIAIGNIVGSNIFNILSVTGIAALFEPLYVGPETLYGDGPIMLAAAVLAASLCWKGRTIRRGHGLVLLAIYAAFLAWNVIRVTH